MTTVVLVRHGRTTSNAEGTLAGRMPGVHLDEVGRKQVAALSTHLDGVRWSAAVTSPMERCQQTLEGLIGGEPGFPVHIDDRLSECDYGEWTGQALKTLAKDPVWKVVQSHPAAAVFPGGESLSRMQHRAVSAIRDWNEQLGRNAVYVVVSHGDVIKAVLADALGLHLDHFQRIRIDPASVSIVNYTPLRPFVDRMNDTGAGAAQLTRAKRGGKSRSSDAVVGGGAGG